MFFYFLASELLLNKSIPDKFVSDNIQMLTELHIFLLNLLLIRQSILPFLKVSLKYLSSEADILSFATPHEKKYVFLHPMALSYNLRFPIFSSVQITLLQKARHQH